MSNKTDNDSDFLTRRHFFRQGACAALGVTGMVNTLTHLRLIGGAMAQDGGTGGGHKAIVCLYLQGGNDSSNMILPMGPQPVYDQYASDRGDIAIDLEDADGNLLVHPITPDSYDDGVDYAFSRACSSRLSCIRIATRPRSGRVRLPINRSRRGGVGAWQTSY